MKDYPIVTIRSLIDNPFLGHFEINGMDLSDSVTGFSVQWSPNNIPLITLTVIANLDIDDLRARIELQADES